MNVDFHTQRTISSLRADARAVNPTGPWCGPTVVARVLGVLYAEAERAYCELRPSRYTFGKVVRTYTHGTHAILRARGVKINELNPYTEMQAQPLDNGPRAKPTLTRIMRRVKPGWYVVSIPGHIMLIERRPGDVYNTKNPCCFIWDNCAAGYPVGSRRGRSRHGGSLVCAIAHLPNFVPHD